MSIRTFVRDLYETLVPHAVAAHFSNGIVPVSMIFLLLALYIQDPFFERTVLHLNIVVLLAIPCSFFTGIFIWQTRFKGASAPIFLRKLRLSILLFLLGITTVGIRWNYPVVLSQWQPLTFIYVGGQCAMLLVVTLLGHYGAKLTLASRRASTQTKPSETEQ